MIWKPRDSSLLLLTFLLWNSAPAASDWPMFGGDSQRSLQSDGRAPRRWSLPDGHNVGWVAELGSQTYSSPVISGGKVFVGTNNDKPRNPKLEGDMGVLMVFRESDGEFLWQAASDKLETGAAQDWPGVGVCSSPLVVGDRVYFVDNRGRLVALDTEGFRDGGNDGPIADEGRKGPTDADYVWTLDFIQQLGVSPHNASNSSPALLGDLIFVGTSNGRSEDHRHVVAPDAPSLVAIDRHTGQLVWSEHSPGEGILNGQWTSPTVARIGGVDQVIIGHGDGWVRSFRAASGERLWEFDTNPKDSVYPESRNEILGTPGVSGHLVYIANGQDPENGEGDGHLYAIDGRGRGDITQSGKVWHYPGIRRSVSSPVIHQGRLYYPDFSGFFHCLDARTGKVLWVHDTFSAIWGSPVVVGDHVYLGDEDGDVVVLKTGDSEQVVQENSLADAIYTTPSPSNDTLYIATMGRLYALRGQVP